MSRYVRDHGGIGRMLRGEGIALGAHLERRGLRVMRRAEALSAQDTGSYRAGWRLEVKDPGGVHNDRLEVQVYNDDDAAAANELGNGHNVAPHTLLKAVGAAGGMPGDS